MPAHMSMLQSTAGLMAASTYISAYLATLIGPPGCPGRPSSICCGHSELLQLHCHLWLSSTGSGRGSCRCFSPGIILQKSCRRGASSCKLKAFLQAAFLSRSTSKQT